MTETNTCEAYCPKDIVLRLEDLGFERVRAETSYGGIAFYNRRRDDGSTASLFLHGVSSDATEWSPVLECASELGVDLGNVLLVDLPGFGRSENRLDTMWIPEVGGMLVNEAARLGYDRLRLVGHSMGGFLALDMAARFHNSVRSVHVAAGSYFAILNTIKRPVTNTFRNPRTAILWNVYHALCLADGVGAAIIRASAALLGPRVIAAPFVARPKHVRIQVFKVLLSHLNTRGVVLTARNGPSYNAAKIWADIAVPLTAVFGREDLLVTAWDARELARVNPHARIRWVDEAGHMLVLERPAAVLRALEL